MRWLCLHMTTHRRSIDRSQFREASPSNMRDSDRLTGGAGAHDSDPEPGDAAAKSVGTGWVLVAVVFYCLAPIGLAIVANTYLANVVVAPIALAFLANTYLAKAVAMLLLQQRPLMHQRETLAPSATPDGVVLGDAGRQLLVYPERSNGQANQQTSPLGVLMQSTGSQIFVRSSDDRTHPR